MPSWGQVITRSFQAALGLLLVSAQMPFAGERLSAAEYLQSWGGSLFPFYFDSLLHPFFCSLLPMDPDCRIGALQRDFPLLVETILGPEAAAHLQRPAAQSSSEARSVADLACEPPPCSCRERSTAEDLLLADAKACGAPSFLSGDSITSRGSVVAIPPLEYISI